jgi:hypothetical protein
MDVDGVAVTVVDVLSDPVAPAGSAGSTATAIPAVAIKASPARRARSERVSRMVPSKMRTLGFDVQMRRL